MTTTRKWRRIQLGSLGSVLLIITLLIIVGCFPPPQRGNGAGDGEPVANGGGEAVSAVRILNFLTDVGFSDDRELTVKYSTPQNASDVVGFWQILTGRASEGGSPTGIEEVIAEGLPAGSGSFIFDTTDLGAGFYQLGVRADGEVGLSRGTIDIQGPPNPIFTLPDRDLTVNAGTPVSMAVNVGDPQGKAQWRLFFQDEDEPRVQQLQEKDGGELLGEQLALGSGNTAALSWRTTNVPVGVYVLGLSATDSGLSVEGAFESAQDFQIITSYSDATVEIRLGFTDVKVPSFRFESGDLVAFAAESVEIEFRANTFEGDEFVVEVFYIFADQTTLIEQVTDPDVSSVEFRTAGLVSGEYVITATVSDGVNPIVETDEDDQITVTVVQASDATLTVTNPPAPRQAGQEEDVLIQWETNVPPGEGRSIAVTAQPLTTGGQPTGTVIEIAADVPLTQSSAIWDTGSALGRHEVTVTLTAPELTGTLKATAPEIKVSRTPMVIWAGSLGQGSDSLRAGEVYEGVNFKDAAGTMLTSAADYDGDGRDEFIIVSRFGKPFFLNESGTGSGEAYLIYGGQRENRTVNLNSVGTEIVRGITFAGIQPADAFQDRTDGLSTVRLISDQDGDGLPEMVFGFPFTTSRGYTWRLREAGLPGRAGRFDDNGALERPRQFERGGIVVVSSTNPMLGDPPTNSNPDLPVDQRSVINLDLVGQNFDSVRLDLLPDDPDVGFGCSGIYPDDQYATDTVDLPEDCQDGDPDLNECKEPVGPLLSPTNCPVLEVPPGGGDPVEIPCCCVEVDICARGSSDECFETFFARSEGFGRALANHMGFICNPITQPLPATGPDCPCFNAAPDFNPPPNPVDFHAANCGAPPLDENGEPCLLRGDQLVDGVGGCGALGLPGGGSQRVLTADQLDMTHADFIEDENDMTLGSGYYPLILTDEDDNPVLNAPRVPYGARIIGNSPNMTNGIGFPGDEFGTSIAVSGGLMLISAPGRVADLDIDIFPPLTDEPNNLRGLMYLFNIDNLWPDESTWGDPESDAGLGVQPPLPFQYQMGPFPAPPDAGVPFPCPPGTPTPCPTTRNWPSHCGRSSIIDARPTGFPHRIMGDVGEAISVVEGIPDFNLDGREDFAVGAPLANGGDGAVYLAYRRDPFLEGDYLLERLTEDPTSPTRLAGLLITGGTGDGFGEVIGKSLAVPDDNGIMRNQTVDFNGDERDDAIFGNPNADSGRGEIIVVFATHDLVSPLGGFTIDELLAEKDAAGNPRAVRIRGAEAGDLFGFNVAVAGDFDGDGRNDLLIAAPGASPKFDSNDDGSLDTSGIDVINLEDPDSPFGDGVADDVDGDGNADLLIDAGQVYLILGLNNLVELADDTNTIDISSLGTGGFRGLVIVGREADDKLGGGESQLTVSRGDPNAVPPTTVQQALTFRSFGIGPAGDVDGDGRDDIAIGSILASPRNREGAGEVYLIYGFVP